MKIFMSILVGMGVIACIICAGWLMKDEDREDVKVISPELIVVAIGIGILVGVINYFIPMFAPGTKLYFMAPICLAIMLAVSVFAVVWFCKDGADWRAMLPLMALAAVVFFPTQAAAIMTAAPIQQGLWATLIMVLPLVMLVLAIGLIVTDWLYFRFVLTQNDIDKILAIIAGVVTGVIILLLLIANVDWKNQIRADVASDVEYEEADDGTLTADEATMAANEDQQVVAEDVSAEDLGLTWYKFYHYDLLNDADIADDFNFGPSAYAEGIKAEQVKAVHFQRVEEDPALGVATFATFDVRLGTDFIMPGEHYDQNWSDGYWTTRINERAQYYMSNQEKYEIAVERWESFVDTYTIVTLGYQTNITDQMYMVSLTSQSELEAPEVIIAETIQPDGYILSYKTLIKGNEFVVPFRTDCGFQPTNVAEPMKETPQANPVVKVTGGKEQISDPVIRKETDPENDPTPNHKETDPQPHTEPQKETDPHPQTETNPPQTETNPPQTETNPPQTETNPPQTETNPPQTEAKPKKDPSKGTKVNVEPIDDPSPGTSTNNGVGTTSTADQSTNSNYMTQPEYNQTVEEPKEVNQNQKTGSDPSTPSVSAPESKSSSSSSSSKGESKSTKVDNNGDTGTATAAPINKPTPKASKDTVADDPESVGIIEVPD